MVPLVRLVLIAAVFVVALLSLDLVAVVRKTEIAEAAPPAPTLTYPSPNPNITNGVCNSQQLDFTPHSVTMYVGQRLTFIVDACLKSGGTDSPVTLLEEDGVSDDGLDSELVFIAPPDESVRLIFYLDCEDGPLGSPNVLQGHSGYSQDFDGNATLAVELGSSGSTNRYDNRGAETGLAYVNCLDGPCPGGAASGVESAILTACSGSVGGIAEAPDLSDLPQTVNSEKDETVPIAAGVAGTVAVALSATGAILYKRRHHPTEN